MMRYRVEIIAECVKKHLETDAICTALAENLTILTSNDSSDCDEESLGAKDSLMSHRKQKKTNFRESARKSCHGYVAD